MQLNWGDLTLGWREGLLALILLVGVYMLLLLWKMGRINRRQAPVVAPLPQEPRSAEPEPAAARPDFPDTEPSWAPPSGDFAREAFMDGVERELEQMREEIDALRGAMAGLREEVAGLREELQQEALSVRAVQNASPLYSDAMQMAMLGHDPLTISERCGIARAEAELVVALVKNRDA